MRTDIDDYVFHINNKMDEIVRLYAQKDRELDEAREALKDLEKEIEALRDDRDSLSESLRRLSLGELPDE